MGSAASVATLGARLHAMPAADARLLLERDHQLTAREAEVLVRVLARGAQPPANEIELARLAAAVTNELGESGAAQGQGAGVVRSPALAALLGGDAHAGVRGDGSGNRGVSDPCEISAGDAGAWGEHLLLESGLLSSIATEVAQLLSFLS